MEHESTANTTPVKTASEANSSQPSHQHLPYGVVRPDLYPPKSSHLEKETVTLNTYQQELENHFERYGLSALLIGLLSAFCFFRNPAGITYPIFIAAAYAVAYFLLPSLGIEVKKDSSFLAGAALVLGINSCATASPIIHHFNTWAQLFLGSVFLLHQCYEDRTWNVGKYLTSILQFWLRAIGSLHLPFFHGFHFIKGLKSAMGKNILMALAGILAGIPAVLYLGSLLSKADAVFSSMLQKLALNLFNPRALWEVFFLFFLFSLGSYGLFGSICAMGLPEGNSEKPKKNPAAAISFTFMIALLYLFFCLIQILYLFGKRDGLPGDMTYSQYARQGFFQLLSVAVLNLILVLCCLKYFQKHRALSFLLVIISLCTYVMIASALYRMLLYVDAYSLTFLRLFVFWFLGLLAILMIGVLALIFRERFPLFRWCLVTTTLAYAAFAWSRPDYLIAKYNIAQEGGQINVHNVDYLIGTLSADAAPAICDAQIDPEILGCRVYLDYASQLSMPLYGKSEMIRCMAQEHPGIRSFNFSIARAWRLAR